MVVTIVNTTARTGNLSTNVANALAKEFVFANDTLSVEVVEVSDHVKVAMTVPPWGEGGADSEPTVWKDIVSKSDVFVFVLPEYNHSYPGEWKLLMDSLFKEYTDKKAYMVGVSAGSFGGTRVIEHVIPLLSNFKFNLGSSRLLVSNVSKSVSGDGEFTDEGTRERAVKFVDEVLKSA